MKEWLVDDGWVEEWFVNCLICCSEGLLKYDMGDIGLNGGGMFWSECWLIGRIA